MVPEETRPSTGFYLSAVSIFDQSLSVVEVLARDGSGLEFEVTVGAPGDRLLDLLSVVRRAVRAGDLVLLSGLHISRNEKDVDRPAQFVSSVGSSAGIFLPDSSGVGKLIVGRRSAIRFVRLYLKPVPPPEDVIEPPLACTDYSDFARLWTNGEQAEKDATNSEHPLRWIQMIALGKSLGQLHDNGIVHGDTHENNFLFDHTTMTVGVIDFGRSQLLYGPPEPAECATDLLPLMRGLTRRDWFNFKRGYLLSRPDGNRVFDLIENGDRTGWMQALRSENFQVALTRLDEAQQLLDTDATAELARLADRRTWCYRKLGKYEFALSSQTEAIALAEEARTPDVSWYIMNLVVVYHDADHIDLAMSTLQNLLARTDHAADNHQAISQGRKLIQVIRTEPSPPIGHENPLH